MHVHDACDFACSYAAVGRDVDASLSDLSGWNDRYVEGLRLCGFLIIPWPAKLRRPEGTVDAPWPVEGEPASWSVTKTMAAIIVPVCPPVTAETRVREPVLLDAGAKRRATGH